MATNNACNNLVTNNDQTLQNTSASASGSLLRMVKSRNGGAITSGDTIGSIAFLGANTTTTKTTSQIKVTSSGTIGADRVASNLEFYTAPDSASASTQRMVISSAGAVTVNAPDAGTAFTVSGSTSISNGLTLSGGNLAVSAGTATISSGLTVTAGGALVSAGGLNVSGGLTVATGNAAVTAGNITVPSSTSTLSEGAIFQNGTRFIHTRGTNSGSGWFNTFVGLSSGNTTFTIGTAIGNCGVGDSALSSLTTGAENTAIGEGGCGFSISSGSRNTFIGSAAGAFTTTGSNNIFLGYLSGINIGSTDNNIAIGNSGTIGATNKIWLGNSTHTNCDIAGAVTCALGVTATTGNIFASGGSVVAQTGMTTLAGDIQASAGGVRAGGSSSGVAATTTITNSNFAAGGAGVLTINGQTGFPGSNTGFIGIFVGTTLVYVPYFSSIAP